MELKKKETDSKAIKFSVEDEGKEVARAFLYLIRNELHEGPYGLVEDVFVEENYRSRGLGSSLVQELIEEAKRQGCYKLIATSRHGRPAIHRMYERLGFKDHGKEFRMDF